MSKVIAIDVLLVPDNGLLQRAKESNALLRQNYAAGYSLDSDHTPHVTLLHRYIRAADLKEVSAAVSKVLVSQDARKLELTVSGYYSSPWGNRGLEVGALIVEVTPELRILQQTIVDVVQPFAVSGGTADAFVPNTDRTPIDLDIIRHVENFVPASSGEKYAAHVTVGLANANFLRELRSRPFNSFTFKPAGVAIFQLGGVGTARKNLWTSTPK